MGLQHETNFNRKASGVSNESEMPKGSLVEEGLGALGQKGEKGRKKGMKQEKGKKVFKIKKGTQPIKKDGNPTPGWNSIH